MWVRKNYIINTEVHFVVHLCITDLIIGRKMENIKMDTNISFFKKIKLFKLSPSPKIKKNLKEVIVACYNVLSQNSYSGTE